MFIKRLKMVRITGITKTFSGASIKGRKSTLACLVRHVPKLIVTALCEGL
jgi:hypothetical protein